ncbi:cyclin-domain-containing protein, partial [Dissophora ornata]
VIDTAAIVIESIWPPLPGSAECPQKQKGLPLRTFIQETLKRSRSSYSTLQTALFYLYKIRNKVPCAYLKRRQDQLCQTHQIFQSNRIIYCGRRTFLASLMVASKYLQDRNYSNKAWAKISGLSIKEINANELIFLKLIDYSLFVSHDTFMRWTALLVAHGQEATRK